MTETPPGGTLRAAAIQLETGDAETPAARTARALDLVRGAAAGADLVVLPELWRTGFVASDTWDAEAEPLDGPTATALAGAARAGSTWVVGGLLERDGDRLRNTAVAFGPDGRLAAAYRKIHLFPLDSEAERMEPGEEPAVVDLGPVRIGLAICFDLRFPELFRRLVDAGAEAIVVVAAWPLVRAAAWRALLQARAIECQAPVLGCNASGAQKGDRYAGGSVAFDAWGAVVGELGPEPGVLAVDLDVAAARAARRAFPVLGARRLG